MAYIDKINFKGTLYDIQDSKLKEELGEITDLNTATKTDVVSAINEVSNACALFQTVENTPIASFTDGGLNLPVYNLEVGIEPIQSGSGDPSPSNVRPISGFSTVNVTRTGINIWDEETELGSISSSTGENTESTTSIRSVNYIRIVTGESYCLIKPSGTGTMYVMYYDGAKSYLSFESIGGSATITVLTIPATAEYIRLRFHYDYGITYNNDISINYPSTDTSYHAYEGTTYPISLGSTYYGGTLNVTTGVLTVTHGILDLDDATFGISSNRAFINNFNTTYGAELPASAYVYGGYIAEQYTEIKASGSITTGTMAILQTGSLLFDYDGENLPTGKIIFPLSTPTTVQLTPTQVYTLLQDNNIFADSGDIVSLTYRADLATYIQNLINA